jgi:hypothetical protein
MRFATKQGRQRSLRGVRAMSVHAALKKDAATTGVYEAADASTSVFELSTLS